MSVILTRFRQSPVIVADRSEDFRIRFRFFMTVFSRLSYIFIKQSKVRQRDTLLIYRGSQGNFPRLQKTGTPTSRSANTSLSSYLLTIGIQSRLMPLDDLSLSRYAIFPWGFPLAVKRDGLRTAMRSGSLRHFQQRPIWSQFNIL